MGAATDIGNGIPDEIRQVLEKDPSLFLASVHKFEADHQQALLDHAKYRMYVKLMEHNLEDFAKALRAMNSIDRSEWDNRYTLQLLFLSNVPKTLISALNLAVNGYYDESLALGRISYESTLRVCFVERFPDEMWAVVGSKQKGRRHFNASQFLPQDLGVCTEDPFYWFLSHNVHGKTDVLVKLREIRTRAFGGFGSSYQLDESRLQGCLNTLAMLNYFSTRIFGELFGCHLEGTPNALPEPVALETLLRDHPGKFSAIPDLIKQIVDAMT